MTRIAILISGRGSNMLRLASHMDRAGLSAEISLVAANTPCDGLQLAAERGLPTALFDRTVFTDRAAQEAALADAVETAGAEWIFLAGYMAILSPAFTDRFAGRIINIHPSLLPCFKGLDTHARVLDAGETRHGATVHIVNAKLDDGPILLQAGLDIAREDTADALAARVLTLEHMLYPFVLSSLVTGHLRIEDGKPSWRDRNAALSDCDPTMRQALERHVIWPTG